MTDVTVSTPHSLLIYLLLYSYTSFFPSRHALQRTRVLDRDIGLGSTRVGTVRLDLLDQIHTVLDFTKDDVLSVQPRGLYGSDKELGTVRVGSSVGHGQQSGLGVLELEVFIGKLVAVDGLSTGTVSVGEITTLQHKVGDDSVEGGTGVAETLFTGAQGSEVGGGLRRANELTKRPQRGAHRSTHLGDNVVVQLEGDSTSGGAVDGNVKVTVAEALVSITRQLVTTRLLTPLLIERTQRIDGQRKRA